MNGRERSLKMKGEMGEAEEKRLDERGSETCVLYQLLLYFPLLRTGICLNLNTSLCRWRKEDAQSITQPCLAQALQLMPGAGW